MHALRDALWHKAGHPVKISFKKEMARSITVKNLLVDAGVSSAASVLPYLEAEVRKAIKKLHKTFRNCGSSLFVRTCEWHETGFP